MNSLNVLHQAHETKYKQTRETHPLVWIWNLNNTEGKRKRKKKKKEEIENVLNISETLVKAVQEVKIYEHTD